jgi:hypothetical protein
VGLYEEVAGEPVKRWTRQVVDDHLGAEADELAQLLADPAVSPFRIWRALGRRGVNLSRASVYQWAEEARR